DHGEAERPDGVHEWQAQDLGRHGARDEDAEPLQAARLTRTQLDEAGWIGGAIHPASSLRNRRAGGEGMMDEGMSKAIPLRRSRGTAARAVGVQARRTESLTTRLSGGVQLALEPTRQIWLASLGSTTITLRGARELWALLVSEGAATQTWVRTA